MYKPCTKIGIDFFIIKYTLSVKKTGDHYHYQINIISLVTLMSASEVEEVIGMQASKCEYTIDDALDAVGFGSFQWILLVLSAIGFCTTKSPLFNRHIIVLAHSFDYS